MKRVRLHVVIFITVVVLFGQYVFSTGAFGRDQTELLYPERLRYQTYFNGEITPEILTRLSALYHAEALNTLDVLRGSGGDLMLDRTANRMEAATMLVRLLGAEYEALEKNFEHPFTDVAPWADPYVGYLYKNGLTNGIGRGLYGAEIPVNEKSYLTFLLRALGYRDQNGEDFTWETVREKAMDTGLFEAEGNLADEASFKRDRLSELSWKAMFQNHKTFNQPLIVFLFEEGMLSEVSFERLLSPSTKPLINQWLDILPEIENAFVHRNEKIELSITKTMLQSDLQAYLAHMLERAQTTTGVFFSAYAVESSQEGETYTLFIQILYVNTIAQEKKLSARIDEIGKMIFQPEMTDYEKEKAAHDFLIGYLAYDTSFDILEDEIPASSAHAFDVLETGTAVCQGYAELMLLLMNKAGIPCRMVVGTADGISHAWNMVLLDGKPYHVDVTFDDPVTETGEDILRYDYLNVTDTEIKNSHIWKFDDYPACTASEANYYVKNNLIIDDLDLLISALKEVVYSEKPDCRFKLQNIDPQSLDIQKIMKDIFREPDCKLASYAYSYNEDMNVIHFNALEYR